MFEWYWLNFLISLLVSDFKIFHKQTSPGIEGSMVCVRDRLDANCVTKCQSFLKLALLVAVLRGLGHFWVKNTTFSTSCVKLTFWPIIEQSYSSSVKCQSYSCVFSATWDFKPRSTNFLKFQINYLKIKLYELLKISKSCPFLLSRAFKSAFNSFEAYNVTEIQGLPFFWNGLQEKLSCNIGNAFIP